MGLRVYVEHRVCIAAPCHWDMRAPRDYSRSVAHGCAHARMCMDARTHARTRRLRDTIFHRFHERRRGGLIRDWTPPRGVRARGRHIAEGRLHTRKSGREHQDGGWLLARWAGGAGLLARWAGAWLLARSASAGARRTHGSRIEYFRIRAHTGRRVGLARPGLARVVGRAHRRVSATAPSLALPEYP